MATPCKESEQLKVSPTLMTRKDEKNQMINLNNRLAIYVEKVRSLELKNSNLESRILSYEENNFHEVDSVKALFECELREARQLLDEVAKEKAKLEIRISSLQEKFENECQRGNELAFKNQTLNEKLKESENLLSEKSALCDKLESDHLKASEDIEKLKTKVSSFEKEFDSTRDALNRETLLRIDFENKLQSAHEELQFKDRLYQKEIAEVRRRQQMNPPCAANENNQEYENEIEIAIQDLREEQAFELEKLKNELAQNYTLKIKDLTDELENARSSLFKSQELVKSYETKVRRLQDTTKTLQEQTNMLENKIEDVQVEVMTERQLRVSAVAHAEEQKNNATEALKRMEKEYQELLEVKMKLDQEITVYNRLLEEEEQRLRLSPGVGANSAKSNQVCRVRRKRKRVSASTPGEEERRSTKKIARSDAAGVLPPDLIAGNKPPPTMKPTCDQESDANSCLIM